MEPLIIKATEYTPYVCLDKDRGILEIIGVSKPTNVFDFYDNVLLWFDEYMKSPNPKTSLSIKLEYLNTASAKIINHLIKRLELILKHGHEANVLWYYPANEPEMKELGENYAVLYKVPFKYEAYEN